MRIHLRRATIRDSRPSRGQALAEFALVFPLFALLVFAVIQFGMILGGEDALANSVREATRYAATVPVANTTDAGSCSSGVGQSVYARLQAVLQQKLPGYIPANLRPCGGAAPATTVTYCIRPNPVPTGAIATYSIWVKVNAVYGLPLYIPLIGNIVDMLDGSNDGKLRASATEQMRVETYNLSGGFLGNFSGCSP